MEREDSTRGLCRAAPATAAWITTAFWYVPSCVACRHVIGDRGVTARLDAYGASAKVNESGPRQDLSTLGQRKGLKNLARSSDMSTDTLAYP